MKRFLAALCLLGLAGCEQARPPSAAVVAARSALGTKNTNFETKIQPNPPRAGETSVWDFKVYDKKNKPDGTRKEWKFFTALPQSSSDKSVTEVSMNTWLISKDRKIFLPQKPTYKAYGSFLGDWTIPQSGAYTLFVEYQPVVAKDELSAADFNKGSEILPVERGRWDVSVGAGAKNAGLTPKIQPGEGGELRLNAWSLGSKSYGAPWPFQVLLVGPRLKLNEQARLSWQVSGVAGQVLSDQNFVALSPDGKTLVHVVGNRPQIKLSQRGRWHAWFSFSLDGQQFAAPIDLDVI